MPKKQELTEEFLINWWLNKYHNTSIEQLLEENPEWAKNPEAHTREFHQTYKVTQAQHDEWYRWAIDTLAKYKHMSKKYIKRNFWTIYLNTAPSTIQENNEKRTDN